MNNKAMQRKLENGEAIDVSQFPRLGPYYVLNAGRASIIVDNELDLCDRETESWVWSMGLVLSDKSFDINGVTYLAKAGTVLASLGTDLYQREGVDCLWLR